MCSVIPPQCEERFTPCHDPSQRTPARVRVPLILPDLVGAVFHDELLHDNTCHNQFDSELPSHVLARPATDPSIVDRHKENGALQTQDRVSTVLANAA
jgi:hypothetical protein